MCGINRINSKEYFLVFIELLFCCVMIVDSFIKDIISINFLTIVLSILFLLLAFFMNYERDNRYYLTDAIYTIIIIASLYYIAVYLLGLITGFYSNSNDLSFLSIFKNVFKFGLFIIASEMFRYVVATNGKNNRLVLSLLVLILSLCDVSDLIYRCNFSDISDSIEIIGYHVLPSIIKNITLTYISCKISYKPTIFYRVIFELPQYFLPILPNTGLYLQTILNIAIPVIVFAYFYLMLNSKKFAAGNKDNPLKITIKVLLSTFLIFVIGLVTGFFKYSIVAVGSESMTPEIGKGDAVIVKKLNTEEIKNLKIGDIIVFRHSNVVLVHRISNIVAIDNDFCFRTKGDGNIAEDSFITTLDDVIGIVTLKIPSIGLPTVWINELINF